MKLVFYIYKLFLPIFLGSLLFFAFIVDLVDLLVNIWRYLANNVPFMNIMQILLTYLPKALALTLPIALLFSACYVLSHLYAQNEIIALFASGVSLIRFTMPLIVLSFALTFFLVFFEDKVVVPTYKKNQELKSLALKEQKVLNNDHIVILGEQGQIIYKADYYDDGVKRLYKVFVIMRNQNKTLNCIVRADSASWDSENEHWTFSNARQYNYINNDLIDSAVDKELEKRLNEKPETFRNNTISVEESTIQDSKVFIEHLRRAGLPYAKHLSDYYKKFSFPCIMFIVVFLSIGLSGKSKRNVFLISLMLTLGSSVLFYVMQMVTMLMAQFEIISPFSGAWFPVILFMIISGILLKYTRT